MPDPLAKLDGNGEAAVISYNVPEPTSYSGRNFLQIPLPAEAFSTIENATGGSAPATLRPSTVRADDVPALPTTVLSNLTTRSVLAPPSVVVAGGAPDASPVVSSPLPLSDRLKALTNADVAQMAAAGQQVSLYQDLGGQLSYRALKQTLDNRDDPDTGGGGYEPTTPDVWLVTKTPATNTPLHGSAAGVTVAVSGTYGAEHLKVGPTVTVSVDGGGAHTAQLDPTHGTWTASVTLTTAGSHTIRARIAGTGWNSVYEEDRDVTDTADVTVAVTLDPANPEPAPVLPTVVIGRPVNNTTLVSDGPVTAVVVEGTVTCGPGRTVKSVSVTDSVTGRPVAAGVSGSGWSVELPISTLGKHTVTVVATDDKGNASPPQSASLTVVAQQPFRRLKNRLLIVETLNLSSFLGSFGAGRVVKTFSLLPGEKTTISVKSWKKSAESSKSGSSIVDSDATEAGVDFEDTLSAEQTSKEAQSEASNYKVGASAGASWGWGSASITAEYSGSANASREEAVKNLSTATRKHSMKASANRSVTINTEYTATHEEGSEDSTTREIANINVSRTLNFVFRQMNQEHITLIHLTNVRIGYYTEDLLLDAQGNPEYVTDPVTGNKVLNIRHDYVEVPLPELQSLLTRTLTDGWRQKAHDAITNALSGIPDYQDELRTVVEYVSPTKNGQPVPGAEYLRFTRNLKTDFADPESSQVITVPGIVLAYDHIVMRTDGVMVDTVLGQGDGLDSYSHGLQQVAIAERKIGVAERKAELERLELARQLVAAKDKAGADIFAQLFPAPAPETPVIKLVESPASPNGSVVPTPNGPRK